MSQIQENNSPASCRVSLLLMKHIKMVVRIILFELLSIVRVREAFRVIPAVTKVDSLLCVTSDSQSLHCFYINSDLGGSGTIMLQNKRLFFSEKCWVLKICECNSLGTTPPQLDRHLDIVFIVTGLLFWKDFSWSKSFFMTPVQFHDSRVFCSLSIRAWYNELGL